MNASVLWPPAQLYGSETAYLADATPEAPPPPHTTDVQFVPLWPQPQERGTCVCSATASERHRQIRKPLSV